MSGYNYDFVVDVPERLLCQICRLPCRDPQTTVCCGHVFCESELDASRNHQMQNTCPHCHAKDFSAFLDKAIRREINELLIYCPNKKEGCGWSGEMARVDDHLRRCEISCRKCKQVVYSSTMRSHLDTECPCYCPHCDITADREVITSKHKEKCHKFPITCPNNCRMVDIPRDSMAEHKKVCPCEMVQCEYQCGAVIARDKVMEHDRLNLLTHIHKFKSKLDGLFDNITNHCTESERKVTTLLSNVTNELDSFDATFATTKKVDDVDLAPACAKQQLAKTCLCFGIYLIMHLLVVFVALQNYWTNNSTSRPVSTLTEMDERLSLTLSGLIFDCGFKQHPPSNSDFEYELNYWRSSIGIKIIAPFYLEMPDFDKYAVTGTDWYSSPFFAFEGGYVVCLKVYATGTDDGRGTHVSVYLHLMKGPHDDKLKWPMRGEFGLELVDPTKRRACSPYYKTVRFNGKDRAYDRITTDKISYYGLGYPRYINLNTTRTIAVFSNLTVVDTFLSKHNSLLFIIYYYTAV